MTNLKSEFVTWDVISSAYANSNVMYTSSDNVTNGIYEEDKCVWFLKVREWIWNIYYLKDIFKSKKN